MDTGLKKYSKKTFTKAVTLLLSLVCFSGIVWFGITSIYMALKSDMVHVNYSDALRYRILGLEESEWNYSSFRNGYSHLLLLLDDKMDKFGNGTKEDYEKRKKEVEERNNNDFALIKQNMIAEASDDFSAFYLLVNNGILEITATEFTGETKSTASYYSHAFTSANFNFSDFRDSDRIYVEPFMPEAVKESFRKAGYDGAIRLETTKEIIGFDEEREEDTVEKRFLPGYYAFRVNDVALRAKMYKRNISETYYESYDEFRQEYLLHEKQIREHAETAFYYISDGKDNYITNLEGLGKDADSDTLKKVFSRFDKYSYSNNGAIYLNDGSLYSDTYLEYFRFFDDDAWNTVVHTTVVPETSIEISAPVAATTVAKVTSVNETVQATTAFYTYSYSQEASESRENITLYIAFDKDMESDTCHFANMESNIIMAEALIKNVLLVCGLLGILFVIALIVLIKLTGRAEGERIMLRKSDGIFLEIRLLIDSGIAFLSGVVFIHFAELYYKTPGIFPLAAVVISADIVFLALLDLILYLARHIKNKSLHKNTGVTRLCCFLYKKGKNAYIKMKKSMPYIKDVKKNVFIRTAAVILINIAVGICAFCLAVTDVEEMAILCVTALFVFDLFIVYRGLKFVAGVNRILTAVEEMRDGNLDPHISRAALPSYLMLPAENLQGLGDGMKQAVQQAVKQEKTKTELITNVSHDLKTPLTSIISYVDLLKKCDITDETAKSYLNILSEKSDRLKNLIEDLVEASKASAGAIPVNYVSVSLRELINQIIGEFEESFDERGLSLIINMPEKDVTVRADSKLIYRVLENLFVNIKKYAMEGTRVYITVTESADRGIINLKNISAAPLNISADELKERFVRGEQSRTTEGNGLGLSIAENLCTLQEGRLAIEISADLFSVTVEMKKEG